MKDDQQVIDVVTRFYETKDIDQFDRDLNGLFYDGSDRFTKAEEHDVLFEIVIEDHEVGLSLEETLDDIGAIQLPLEAREVARQKWLSFEESA